MNLLEIALLCIGFLYALTLYKILSDMEGSDKRAKLIYEDLCGHIEDLRVRHNSLIDAQKDITERLLNEVNRELEDANTKHVQSYKNFLAELEQVKKFISQGFLRR